jgi:hypothetical protein
MGGTSMLSVHATEEMLVLKKAASDRTEFVVEALGNFEQM